MQDRVGFAHRVAGVAGNGAEPEPGVESRGPEVLFVDVDPPYAAASREVFDKAVAQSLSELRRSYEKHFELVARGPRKGCECAVAVAQYVKRHGPKCFFAYDPAVEPDVLGRKEVVRGAYRGFPKVGQRVEFLGRGAGETFDGHKSVTGGLRRAKLRARAAAKGVS